MFKKNKQIVKVDKKHPIRFAFATLLGIGIGYSASAYMKMKQNQQEEDDAFDDDFDFDTDEDNFDDDSEPATTSWTESVAVRAPRGTMPTQYSGTAPRKHKNVLSHPGRNADKPHASRPKKAAASSVVHEQKNDNKAKKATK
ncbi:hypothetical protein [Lactobacillus selangorensis]|nr:hypothetical protein [Lactobacillus selangorensis]